MGLYSQVPMMSSQSNVNLNISGGGGGGGSIEKKIIIKNEMTSPGSLMTFSDVKLEPSATNNFSPNNNLNSNLL